MAKKKIQIETDSYGIYTRWDRNSKELPRPLEFTTQIPAKIDIEFGMILKITGAKGEKIEYCIKHPPIRDENGNLMPDFKGEYFVNSNNFRFFIGDTIWEPVEEKTGKWEVIVYHDKKTIANKVFTIGNF